MEKYSRWSDLTTGTNPFVPVRKQSVRGGSVVARVPSLLGGALLVLVRVPLLLVGGLLLVTTSAIVSILRFIPLLGRALHRLTEWLLCSLLLLVLGVFVTAETANTRRLGLSTPATRNKKKKSSSYVARGDVLVCNHTSVVEILYLARRFSPVFVFANPEDAASGRVQTCGLLQAIYRSLALPTTQGSAAPRELQEVLLRASGPVVIFPEGARSNGKSVLRFLPVLEKLPLQLRRGWPLRVHVMAFRYEFQAFSPSHSAGAAWKHVLWTCFYGYHSQRATHLQADDLDLQNLVVTTGARPATTSSGAKTRSHASGVAKAPNGDAITATEITPTHVEKMRELLASMLRAKPVDLSVADFLSFNAYWDHVASGGKQSASAFTDRKAPHEHAQWTAASKTTTTATRTSSRRY